LEKKQGILVPIEKYTIYPFGMEDSSIGKIEETSPCQ